MASLVDTFRAIPGVTPDKRDGGFIAGLVRRYGIDAVRRAVQDEAPAIGVADNPRHYLAAICRRGHRRGPPVSLETRKAEILRNLAREGGPR